MRVESASGKHAEGRYKGAALAAIIRYKLSIRLSCHHASNRHCSRCPIEQAWCEDARIPRR